MNLIDPLGLCAEVADGEGGFMEVGLCGNDDASRDFVDSQLSDPDSMASAVEAEAISQGKRIGVEGGPRNSASYSPGNDYGKEGTITYSDGYVVVQNDDGSIELELSPADELFEHELSHAYDDLTGGPSGDGIIESSGVYEGSSAASAVNAANDYRRAKGRGYQRYCYSCTVSEAKRREGQN